MLSEVDMHQGDKLEEYDFLGMDIEFPRIPPRRGPSTTCLRAVASASAVGA